MANLPTSLSFIFLLHMIFTPSAFTTNIVVYDDSPTQISRIYPFTCSSTIKSCTSQLYQHNDLDKESISTFYSINTSDISPISRNIINNTKQDNLVTVPCSCKDVNGTIGYFYETPYVLQPNDTFASVSNNIYSGQVWKIGGEENTFKAGENVSMHLLCGCLQGNNETSPVVTTYTVQPNDTLSSIADLLSSQVGDILSLNPYLYSSPQFLDVGWLLYVPMKKN